VIANQSSRTLLVGTSVVPITIPLAFRVQIVVLS